MALFAERYLRFPDHDRYVVGHRRPLLWPVNVWRVLYPEPSISQLDIFQQAVLGLVRARVFDAEEQGRLLGLKPDLVRCIVLQLHVQRQVDSKGITEAGEMALAGLEEGRSRQMVGYAFQDAVHGEFMPRFAPRLPEIEQTATDGAFPEFLMDRERGKVARPFCVNAGGYAPATFKSEDLFEAYRRYRKEYRTWTQLNRGSAGPDNLRIGGIEWIDSAPIPMYLWCWLYQDEGSEKAWLVSDPFALRKASSWMGDGVRRLAQKNQHMSKFLAGFLKVDPATELTAETLDAMDERIQWEVLARYPWASRVPQFDRYLCAFIRQRNLVTGRERPSDEQLDSLLSEALKLVEGSLQWMLERWPGPSEHLLPKTQKWPLKDGITTFESLGIAAVDGVIATKMARQEMWMIRKARDEKAHSLNALLAATLLATLEHPDHPLRTAPLTSDELRRIVIDLARDRNDADHASGKHFQKRDVLRRTDIVLQWLLKFEEWY